MKCRNCGTEIADKALICYRCGTATAEARYQPAAAKRPSSAGRWLIAIVVLIALFVLAWYLIATYRPGPQARNPTSSWVTESNVLAPSEVTLLGD
jgi:hypothetical protein